MSDEFDDGPEETRETPAPGSAPAVQDHDEEPEERRDTPPRGAAPPADPEGQDPAQAAAEQALAALEANPLYQTLPAGYKRKVVAGRVSVEQAVLERNRQLLGQGNANARRLAAEQAKAAEAIQAMEASHRQAIADLDARTAARLEKFIRQLTGEPEPEVKPDGPADDPRDQLLRDMAGKLDGLTAVQAQQAEEQLVRREMAAVEEYSAADVERAVAAVPYYEQAEQYVESLAFDAELVAINNAYPELSDAQAEQLAAQRVMDMAAALMVEARTKGVSLAAEVLQMAHRHGFQPQHGETAPEPPQNRPRTAPAAPRPGSSGARLADQQRREQGVVAATGGGRGNGGSLREMSADIAEKARNMTDEDWADFIGEGKEGDRRLRQILSQRAE